MKLDSKTGFFVLIFSGMVVIPLTIYYNMETTDSFQDFISDDTVFDPLCISLSENSTKTIKDMCLNQGEYWFMSLGISPNLEFLDDETMSKLLFLKINISEIPRTNFFTKTTIEKAELQIGTLYDAIKFTESSEERFFVTYYGCKNITWSENTEMQYFPCVDENGRPKTDIPSYYGILNPERVAKLNFDLSSHVDHFIERKQNVFSEIISFSAGSFTDDFDFKQKVKECLKSGETRSAKSRCLSKHEILIHGSEFENSGFKPQFVVKYHTEPTVFMRSINTVVFAIYPLMGSFLIYLRGQENSFKSKMSRVCDSLIKEIEDASDGLKNGFKGKGIPRTTIPIEFNTNYTPIVLTSSQPISDVFLFTEAYKGILNSGSLENFNKENQIVITALYTNIFEYNKILDLFYSTIEEARLQIIPKISMPDFIWGLSTNLKIYLNHLANLRTSIIQDIEGEKGVLSILKQEKEFKYL